MYNFDDATMLSRPTYRAAERHPWVCVALTSLTLLAMALLLTFLLAGAMQWRSDVRTQSTSAAANRISRDMHNPEIARTVQVGALR